jgi:hypothetical protein
MLGRALARNDLVGEDEQLLAQDRGLDRVEPAGEADLNMVALIAQRLGRRER